MSIQNRYLEINGTESGENPEHLFLYHLAELLKANQICYLFATKSGWAVLFVAYHPKIWQHVRSKDKKK